MIDGVEGLKSKLNLFLFADWKNPADRHVHIERSRRTQKVASNVAEGPIWRCEGGFVEDEITLRRPGRVAGQPLVQVKRLPSNDVGTVVAFIGERSVRARADVNRPSALGANPRCELPSAQEPAHRSVYMEGTARNHRGVENVCDIEIADGVVGPWVVLDLEVCAPKVSVKVSNAHAL